MDSCGYLQHLLFKLLLQPLPQPTGQITFPVYRSLSFLISDSLCSLRLLLPAAGTEGAQLRGIQPKVHNDRCRCWSCRTCECADSYLASMGIHQLVDSGSTMEGLLGVGQSDAEGPLQQHQYSMPLTLGGLVFILLNVLVVQSHWLIDHSGYLH